MCIRDRAHIALSDGVNLRYHAPGAEVPPKYQLLIAFDDDSFLVFTCLLYTSGEKNPEQGSEIEPETIRLQPVGAASCCDGAVSYTHLDVYKRQTLFSWRNILHLKVSAYIPVGIACLAI